MLIRSMTTALALLISVTAGLAGQNDGVQAGWEIQRSEFSDLWFGALASVGFNGSGPVPLYAPEYAVSLRAAKRHAGIPKTRLDRDGERLRLALEADVSFELLHFVPVYLAGATVEEALEALDAVAAGSPAAMARLRPDVAVDARAIGSVLRTPDQRRVLAELSEALEQEWRQLREADLLPVSNPEATATLQEVWDRDYLPGLTHFLSQWGLDGGSVIVTPTVDLEGRFYHGAPTDPADNVVVVGTGKEGSEPGAALSGLVRELCYAVVRSAFGEIGDRFDDRQVAARESDHAATRCGALLLGRYAPDASSAYQARFGWSLAHGAPTDVDPELRRALDMAMEREIGR